MKKVKYETCGYFGLMEDGSIIDAYLVSQDNDTGVALIYHPKIKNNPEYGDCSSVDLCKFNKKTNAWKPMYQDAYINIDGKDIFKNLIRQNEN